MYDITGREKRESERDRDIHSKRNQTLMDSTQNEIFTISDTDAGDTKELFFVS